MTALLGEEVELEGGRLTRDRHPEREQFAPRLAEAAGGPTAEARARPRGPAEFSTPAWRNHAPDCEPDDDVAADFAACLLDSEFDGDQESGALAKVRILHLRLRREEGTWTGGPPSGGRSLGALG